MLRLPDSWVWDSWYAWDGERHHAFYLRASRALGDPERRHRYPYVGHAVSTDLRSWQVLPDALAISDEPAFDDLTTWTGSVVRSDEGRWHLFYTGLSRADRGAVQRIGQATSTDLVTWTKADPATVLTADRRWYETLGATDANGEAWYDEAWRDPFVFRSEDGWWHMYVTARAGDGPIRGRGVVGHATSRDLVDWTVQPPLTAPGAGFGQLEVTQVEVVDGTPTLLFCCGTTELDDAGRARYASGGSFSVTGPTLHGPFDVSAARRFPDGSLYAPRLVQHEGRWHVIGFRDRVDGAFVGELIDPIPVTSHPGVGLVPLT